MQNTTVFKETYTCHLSAKERTVVAALAGFAGTRPGNGLYVAALIGDDVPQARVRVFMSKLRRKLKGTGWTVRNTVAGGRVAGEYQLVRE